MPRKKTTKELAAERAALAETAVSRRRTPIAIVVDNVRSLDNVGMIFRLCELVRAEHLYLTGYTGYPPLENDDRPVTIQERHARRINKTAVYALPYQPWSYAADPVALVRDLRQQGWKVVVLEQTDASISYADAVYEFPAVLIVGHEREGVRQELVDLADMIIEIPVFGHGNSHNVATATGIVAYKMLESV